MLKLKHLIVMHVNFKIRIGWLAMRLAVVPKTRIMSVCLSVCVCLSVLTQNRTVTSGQVFKGPVRSGNMLWPFKLCRSHPLSHTVPVKIKHHTLSLNCWFWQGIIKELIIIIIINVLLAIRCLTPRYQVRTPVGEPPPQYKVCCSPLTSFWKQRFNSLGNSLILSMSLK